MRSNGVSVIRSVAKGRDPRGRSPIRAGRLSVLALVRGSAVSGPHRSIRHAPVSPNALSKDDAPPTTRMPAEPRTADYRCRGYDDRCGCYDSRRCNDNWSRRCYDYRGRRCDYDWGRRCDYDWPIRSTPSIWSAVKAGTTSPLGTGAANADE
jgi:hypothetical protein